MHRLWYKLKFHDKTCKKIVILNYIILKYLLRELDYTHSINFLEPEDVIQQYLYLGMLLSVQLHPIPQDITFSVVLF